ncbi:hypothetical protein ACU8KH_00420 [Lachancea thermotolerans]
MTQTRLNNTYHSMFQNFNGITHCHETILLQGSSETWKELHQRWCGAPEIMRLAISFQIYNDKYH